MKKLVALVLAAASALALMSCGIKGDLYLPQTENHSTEAAK